MGGPRGGCQTRAMTNPARLRAQAEDLRDAARTLRTKAPQLDDDTHGVLTHYPHTSDGVWWGQAADEFYALVQGARTSLRELADDVQGYAARCDTRATELEDEADRLEREQAAG